MTNTFGRHAVGAALVIISVTLNAHAQQTSDLPDPWSLRFRFDTIFAGTPHYVLTAQDNAASADDRYWRVIILAPLQERVTADATGMVDGHVDAHLVAWGAIDLTAPTADGHIAGDIALAWIRYRRGPVAVWSGRRFIAWGAPGGVHLDGGGAELQLGSGVNFEVVTGRPVTPMYGGLLGAQPGFDGETAAAGARLGWSMPGVLSTAVSFLEQWAAGIPTRRVVEMSLVATPLRWMDVRGTISWDMLGFGVMQADLDASAWIARRVEFDVGCGHMNPELLIPRWSILSVFVTRTFDEARARTSWRVAPTVQIGAEGAVQYYEVPGLDPSQYGPQWGSRFEVFLRASTPDRRFTFLANASHRDDGTLRMTLMRLAGSFRVFRDIMGALEAAAALDNDDFTAPRTSWYGRASVDGPVAPRWRVGASFDAVRSSIAASELRAMLHVTASVDLHRARP